jgi:tetratricopeptide (TPR) repeat protein
MGRTVEAERGMRKQLAMYHAWLKQHPGDPQLREEAANVASWLGSLALRQGRLGVAEDYFGENVRDLGQNMTAQPDNADWKEYSVDALGWLADAQEQLGQLVPARASVASATALAAALYARDPENNEWRAALARCRLSQSELDAANQPRKAAQEAEFAESLLAAAYAKDPKNQYLMKILVHTHNQLAWLALSRGDIGRAAKAVASSLALIEPAWNGKQDEDLRVKFAQTHLLQGEIAQRMGKAEEAKSAWNQVRGLLVADSKSEVAFDRLDLLVRTLQRLGQGREAAPYLERLAASGYVPLRPWPGDATSLAGVAAPGAHGARPNAQ